MDIKYYSITNDINTSKRSYVLLKDNKEIGSVEGYLLSESTFSAVVNIFPAFQDNGYGFEVFKTVFEELNTNNKVNTIRGMWCSSKEYNHSENGISTNLNEFLKKRQTHSDIESVFMTPTGKWVKKLGFNNANIIKNSEEEVIVDFTK